ncbi:hypothetical protein ACFVAJ_10300 [Agromyces sp. NPDC057679]|uniref:hypothetical protein n=1 Tax=Agromyces sp. NPDC057679 TaxID=3346207 RepID=UPI00366FF0AF
MDATNWTDALIAIGGIATPIVVAIFGFVIAHRQSRSKLLQEARFEYYKQLAPDLNRLMCYITFIGRWRDESPIDIVELKRRLDSNFHVAVPLFSKEVSDAYRKLLDLSFATFGYWGRDARIRSSAYRRRQSWIRQDVAWKPTWDELFAIQDAEVITGESLTAYRHAYDDLISKLVADLSITRARQEYTTANVSYNAGAPAFADIVGKSGARSDGDSEPR